MLRFRSLLCAGALAAGALAAAGCGGSAAPTRDHDGSSTTRGPLGTVGEPARGSAGARRPSALDRGHRYRRPGAVFNDEVGENILTLSYRQVVGRFGPPLNTSMRPGGERCAFYAVVGDATGWVSSVIGG